MKRSSISMSRNWRIIASCIAVGIIVAYWFGTKETWETVELPAGEIADVFAIDLYAPFSRSVLLDNADDAYGEPTNVGSDSKGRDYVFWNEYEGKHGRIRVYTEAYESDEGWVDAKWLRVYPRELNLSDAIHEKCLSDIRLHDGKWKLSFIPLKRSWAITLVLEGTAISEISDHPFLQ